jgi:V-type H+-transporting ATPase subunit C
MEKRYWLISAPKTREDTFNSLNKKTDEAGLSVNYKFTIPDLKVGTLDSLMALNDELGKIDIYVESATKKIATQLFEVIDTKSEKIEVLTVNNNNVETYLTWFHWDEAKYSTSQSLKSLTDSIQAQVAKLDEELRIKSQEYNTLSSQIASDQRKLTGNYLTKDLSDVIQREHIVESEFMTSLFIVVPKYYAKDFLSGYEKFSEFVVPRSALSIAEDADYVVYRVVLFKKYVETFKTSCRERKFVVRDFIFDPNRSAKEERKKMDVEREKQKKALTRWCKTYFSEAFTAWIHLKAIRVFVESVLRYGLPTNFQAMLILPQKNKIKKLRNVLNELYGHLGSKVMFGNKGAASHEEGEEEYFPYVFLEINLDFKPRIGV